MCGSEGSGGRVSSGTGTGKSRTSVVLEAMICARLWWGFAIQWWVFLAVGSWDACWRTAQRQWNCATLEAEAMLAGCSGFRFMTHWFGMRAWFSSRLTVIREGWKPSGEARYPG